MGNRILLAAGGTGGHIIPAIAFGQYLQERGESVTWLCGSRPLESEIFKAHHAVPRRLSLEGSPLGVSGLRSVKRWWSLVSSFFESRRILKEEKIERCALFGGYLSMPVLLAARSLGIPVIMHEQNTVAGKVTRFAARLGVPVATAWERCEGLGGKRRVYTGMPLRKIKLSDRKEAQRQLLGISLEKNAKLMVILGGSLGSRGMKKTLQAAQDMIELSGYRVLCMGIITEERPFPEAFTHDACWDMGPVYSAADLIVCRAGAATLAELEALGIPSVIVPWPGAADQHQLNNAAWFSELTGAPVFLEGSSHEQFQNALAAAAGRGTGLRDMSFSAENLYKALRSLSV